MKEIEDLTGRTFGKWKVISISDKKTKNRQIYWNCKCECGTERPVCSGNLKNGSSTGCGCSRKRNSKDIKNQRFGRLVALEPTSERAFSNIVWKCKCDCGNICYIRLSSLTSGNTKSCGCLHKEVMQNIFAKDLAGKKFSHLTVIKKVGIDKNGKQLWECECDCRNHTKIIVTTSSLTTGKTQSCGCKKSKGEERVAQLLTDNNIPFIKQKSFETCRFIDTNALAKFDFYINNKYLIEYDGSLHYFYSGNGWNNESNFLKIQEHDNFKNQWCKENNIPLIRIPYTHYNDLCIEDLLLETSNFII